jgi:DNA repair and recombination protein RAD54B
MIFLFNMAEQRAHYLFQLRDIFRIQPDTACNTHDLLGCGCGGRGMSGIQSVDTRTEVEEAAGVDGNNDDYSSEHGFVNASQLNADHLDKADKAVTKFCCDHIGLQLTQSLGT